MQREGRHVLSHAAIYLVARGVPGIIAFLAIPLFTRLLSPAEYGRYALVIATANLLNALVFQWLRLSLVRYLPVYKEDDSPIKSTLATVCGLLILALGAVCLIGYALGIGGEWRAIGGMCWALLAVQAVFELCNEYSRAVIRPWRYMTLQVARSGSTVVLGAGLIYFGMGWRAPLIGTTIGMALATVWVWRGDWAGTRFHLDRAILRKLCAYGIPLSLTVALAVVIGSCDRFLIAWFLGEDSAGLYSVAADFTAQTLFLLMMVIQLAMFPIAVRAFEQQGKEAAQQQMRLNAALLMAIGVPCVIGIALLAPGIANCFLGRNYRAAAGGIMPLVALGAFLAAFKAFHFDAAFQFAHRTIHQVWIVLVVAVLNVLLNFAAIPIWGINGSALASVVAYGVSITLTIAVGRRHFVLPFPGAAAVKVLAAGGAMALLLLPLRGYRTPAAVVAEVMAAAMVYLGLLIGCNFLDIREAAMARLSRWHLAVRARAASVAAGRLRADVSGRMPASCLDVPCLDVPCVDVSCVDVSCVETSCVEAS